MALELVPAMKETPATCLFCGCTPTDENGQPLPAVTDSTIDVNWGDSVYVCWTCAGLIADLIDRPDASLVEQMKGRVKFEKARADKATAELAKAKKRLDAIVQGQQAVRAVKKEAEDK